MKQTDAFIYKIAARTEAAGKYDSGAPREGNEDSFAIIPNVGNIEAAVSFDTFPPRRLRPLILSSSYSPPASSPAISLQAIPSHPSLPPRFSGVNFLCPYYLGISGCSTGRPSQFS